MTQAVWTSVDVNNVPDVHMIALYSDGSGAVPLTKFDDHDFMMAEDGWEMTPEEVLKAFSWWIPAPPGFRPRFMEVVD